MVSMLSRTKEVERIRSDPTCSRSGYPAGGVSLYVSRQVEWKTYNIFERLAQFFSDKQGKYAPVPETVVVQDLKALGSVRDLLQPNK